MRVVVTGGGSGGHIYPALAVADALRRQDASTEIAYVGGTAGMEARIVPDTGLRFEGVTTRKLTKLVSPNTFAVLLALLKGYREAKSFLTAWRPDVAVGTGGYVAAATILAASRQGIPTIILSPDAIAGRTNRWLSRWAKRICLWLGSEDEFSAGKIIRTGLPIRPEVIGTAEPAVARRALGLEDTFTVLVVGGSQGAQRVNELVVEAAGLLPANVQVLHQTGERNYEDVVRLKRSDSGARHILKPYLGANELPLAYPAADLLICRSGVGMLAEGTANGLPLLMIPLPTAYADHQTQNARAIERGGGGILLAQPTLTGKMLAAEILNFRDNEGRRTDIATASRTLGKPEAADTVARLIEQFP